MRNQKYRHAKDHHAMRNSYAMGEPLQGIKERSRAAHSLMPKIKQANGAEPNQKDKKKLDKLFLNNRMMTL